jgi:hypothetical protein
MSRSSNYKRQTKVSNSITQGKKQDIHNTEIHILLINKRKEYQILVGQQEGKDHLET